jgi:hypothetical protein
MGSVPPPTSGNLCPISTGRGGGRGFGPQGGCRAARHQVVNGGASRHREGASGLSEGAPRPSRKRKGGFSSLR